MFARAEQFGGIIDDQINKIEVEAKRQVGQFLQYPSKLRPYINSSDPATRNEAIRLNARNLEIEDELNKTLAFIDKLKSQGITLKTVTDNAGEFVRIKRFLADFNDHKNKVDRFLGNNSNTDGSGKSASEAGVFGDIDATKLAIGAGVLGLVGWLIKRKG